ncbi:MAG: bacillithiol system redox-active protein YtxJ [Brumimicrobium sp.]|nr:bacillithiol system redox-active protein YtxJ [Brumimicrobium sp.]
MGLFSFNKNKENKKLNWTEISTEEQLEKALATTSEKPAVFFKHSTRCSISSMALNRFENEWESDSSDAELYFIDLIAYRNVSNALAQKLNVEHQSPQVIAVKNGEVVYADSHNGISASKTKTKLSQ